MGRKSLAELIADMAGALDADAREQEVRAERCEDGSTDRPYHVGAKDALRNMAGRLRGLSQQIACAPVSADPDGLFADLARELGLHTPRTQPHIDDTEVASRIKMARVGEREYVARRIGEILTSYEEG